MQCAQGLNPAFTAAFMLSKNTLLLRFIRLPDRQESSPKIFPGR
jgi:hypothetical protein